MAQLLLESYRAAIGTRGSDSACPPPLLHKERVPWTELRESLGAQRELRLRVGEHSQRSQEDWPGAHRGASGTGVGRGDFQGPWGRKSGAASGVWKSPESPESPEVPCPSSSRAWLDTVALKPGPRRLRVRHGLLGWYPERGRYVRGGNGANR